MLRLTFFLLITLIFDYSNCYSQDTLPNITVKNINNNIIVSWTNNLGKNISAINIQRSNDSIRNYTTIGSVLEPMNRENGFVDNKAPNSHMFYRVFVAFEGGDYFFTRSYRPFKEKLTDQETATNAPPHIAPAETNPEPIAVATAPSIAKKNSLLLKKTTALVPNLANNLPKVPTLVAAPVPIPPPPPPTPSKYIFVPSKFIFTGRDNNLIIDLTEMKGNHFSVKFFDEKDNLIFEIKKIAEPYLIIEKVNFKHAGWFYFKLFENGILKERNQFYIPKEGKTGIPASEMNRQLK